MRAIVYREIGAIDVLELQDVPTPKPAAGELLVRVCASTIDASVLTRFPGGMAPRILRQFLCLSMSCMLREVFLAVRYPAL